MAKGPKGPRGPRGQSGPIGPSGSVGQGGQVGQVGQVSQVGQVGFVVQVCQVVDFFQFAGSKIILWKLKISYKNTQYFFFLKKGDWSAKNDLKDAYFHRPLHQSLKPYLRMEVGGMLGFSSCMFWLKCYAPIARHESVGEKNGDFKEKICFIYVVDILFLRGLKK